MTITDPTIIIADDLTGANDTALQFFKQGYSARIIIDFDQDFSEMKNVDVWSVTTESRNTDKETAVDRIVKINEKLKDKLSLEHYYKKIDSTLRGNTGVEIAALLEASGKEIALIAPAYIEENRTTLGAYQLLNGVPIERTQCALDPKAPIYDSYIPDILKKNLNPAFDELIGIIDFKTISKGAGPIILKLNELVKNGKKLIVLDAASNVDLEQIALAINKSSHDILPCGSAGLANAINKINDTDNKNEHIKQLPNLATLTVCGSATQLTLVQIGKLKETSEDIFFVDLTLKDVIEGINDDLINQIVEKLNSKIDVVVHSSYLNNEIISEKGQELLIDAGIAKNDISNIITDYLADLLYEINLKSKFILTTVGGETSYKCARKIESAYLEIIDNVMPAIPLCVDANGQIIVTKSGNFGNYDTLVNVLNFFKKLKEQQD